MRLSYAIKVMNQFGFVHDEHSAVAWLESACDRGFLPCSLTPERGWCTIEQKIFDLWQVHVAVQPMLMRSNDRDIHKTIDGDLIFVPEDECVYEWIENAIKAGFLQDKYAPDKGWCKVPAQAMIVWDAHVKVNPDLAQPDECDPLWPKHAAAN